MKIGNSEQPQVSTYIRKCDNINYDIFPSSSVCKDEKKFSKRKNITDKGQYLQY